jgi:Transposase DDE domain
MLREEFIIAIYCLIDDTLKQLNLPSFRSRGFAPSLSDSEVITMEIVGEFIGYSEDKAIWGYFKHHWMSWFPPLGHRSTLVRPAAYLWQIKPLIRASLARKLGALDDNIHIVDGFPIPVCHFRRAHGSRVFKGSASYGYCASKKQTYYGFQGLISINVQGTISDITLTQAHVDEREALWDVVGSTPGLVIGDKGFICSALKSELAEKNLDLQTPLRQNMKDNRALESLKRLKSKRRLVETVIGQLAQPFKIEQTQARDLWHLTNRINRKVLAHTVGIFLNQCLGNRPLQLATLLEP